MSSGSWSKTNLAVLEETWRLRYTPPQARSTTRCRARPSGRSECISVPQFADTFARQSLCLTLRTGKSEIMDSAWPQGSRWPHQVLQVCTSRRTTLPDTQTHSRPSLPPVPDLQPRRNPCMQDPQTGLFGNRNRPPRLTTNTTIPLLLWETGHP